MVTALADAKSRQDVDASMKLFHRDMVLDVPAFGMIARGEAENRATLIEVFAAFPDYAVVLDGHAASVDGLACWGTVRMTMTGDRFGVVPNGRRAELPVFVHFDFRDDLIVRERFLFDLATLCAQSGVSTDAVRRKLFAEVGV